MFGAAFDRAEYSLHEATIVIALVIGGATLAAMGVGRLRNAGFRAMPKTVAVGALVGGIAVVAFGGVLLVVAPTEPEAEVPRATLEPISEGDDRVGDGTGAVGRVVTPSGRGVEGSTVELVPLFEDKGVETLETTSDAEGRFRFDDVKIDPGSPYVAEVSYGGARFSTEVLRGPRTDDAALTLVVARATRNDAALDVDAESLAIVGDSNGLQAVHALSIENGGKRAYVGGLHLPLLRGAAAIQEGAGLDRRRLNLEEDGMTSAAPILPGSHDLTYTYVTQMSKDGIALTRGITLPTERYELLVAGELDFEPTGGLAEDGEVRLGPQGDQRTYRRFVARNLEAGDELAGRIGVARGPGTLRIAAPVAAAIVALAIVVVPLLLRRRRSTVAPAPQREPAAEAT